MTDLYRPIITLGSPVNRLICEIRITDCDRFLGEMQRIAFRLMLSSCVCVCVCLSVCVCMPRLWTSGKRLEIETSFSF